MIITNGNWQNCSSQQTKEIFSNIISKNDVNYPYRRKKKTPDRQRSEQKVEIEKVENRNSPRIRGNKDRNYFRETRTGSHAYFIHQKKIRKRFTEKKYRKWRNVGGRPTFFDSTTLYSSIIYSRGIGSEKYFFWRLLL